ncbi:ABC transporter substrate-binding protein [Galactobacter caseinivorans]|uniref:Glycine/betaine ABC transporter n=1 Tax=Galactobacter caseinivorans TaxID=2676123 RepID=A0A496PFF4_9MICC|nr:ABC transporter substrate-binding protein [Galactobacter caseinivorans]RKW69431.1 glycine/betaine ABC transporter [Galactobacter caseinivorans]
MRRNPDQTQQPRRRRAIGTVAAIAAVAALGLSACGSSDPLASSSSAVSSAPADTLVVGSQQYYSNAVIAELYAQSLEGSGFKVDRQFNIGQREVYMGQVSDGKIDVFPEYTGNLLQYLDKKATATDPAEVLTALKAALPSGLSALEPAGATDQDSFNVTAETAQKHGLKEIGDLSKLPQPVKIAGNSELAKRPYGPDGLKSAYGVTAEVQPVEDGGGPLTVKALKDGTVPVSDLYSADPAIATNKFVTLADPKHLVLPQNVVPLVSTKVDDKAKAAIDAVNAKLSTEELVELNRESSVEKKNATDVAKAWLAEQGIVKAG